MNTNLQEREFDGVVAEGADHLEVSNTIKAWLNEQDRDRPFGVGWPLPRRLELELKNAGFTHVTVAQLPPHSVFIVKGRAGHLGFNTTPQLRRYFRKIAREIGFPFREADTALSCLKGQFRLVLVLATEDTALESFADDCPFDLDVQH